MWWERNGLFENENKEELLNYLNSLESVNKKNSNELVKVLSKFFMEIKKNND